MMKLFRDSRKQFLTDNKFSKYLIYAIGEIILVVIGILIAVQVNDLNEQKKVARISKTYLNKMILELETTKTRMEYLAINKTNIYLYGLPSLEKAVINCDSLLKLSYSGITKENLPFFVNTQYLSGQSSLNIQQDVFEEAKSNGHLNELGSDKLIAAIKSYNSRCVREIGYNQLNNDELSYAIKKMEDGLGKLLLDYEMDFMNFSIENYKWLLNKNSKEYKDMQIGLNLTKWSQSVNMNKMMEMYALSDSLINMIKVELENTQN